MARRERERQLRREPGGQPATGQAGGQQRHRRGHGQQVARRAREENRQRAREEDRRSRRAGRASRARAACARRRSPPPGTSAGKTINQAVDEEHQRRWQLVRERLEPVGGEVAGELAGGHGAGGDAREDLPRRDRRPAERGSASPGGVAVLPVEQPGVGAAGSGSGRRPGRPSWRPRPWPAPPSHSRPAQEQRDRRHPERQKRQVGFERSPFTTNAGTARNSSAAQTGCGEKRRASDHMAHTAISENTR